MSLLSMLDQAQGGRLFTLVARSVDLDEAQTRKAMAKLCPAIAERPHARPRKDEELFQSLHDLISDNGAASPLDDADSLTGSEAMSDGNAILDDVFGSRSAAMAALRAADPSIPERELAKLPPFGRLAAVIASGPDIPALEAYVQALAAAVPNAEGVEVFGPADAPQALVRGRRRKRFLVRADRSVDLQGFLSAWRARAKVPNSVRVVFDVDPHSFL